jgi:hypothetical protein
MNPSASCPSPRAHGDGRYTHLSKRDGKKPIITRLAENAPPPDASSFRGKRVAKGLQHDKCITGESAWERGLPTPIPRIPPDSLRSYGTGFPRTQGKGRVEKKI